MRKFDNSIPLCGIYGEVKSFDEKRCSKSLATVPLSGTKENVCCGGVAVVSTDMEDKRYEAHKTLGAISSALHLQKKGAKILQNKNLVGRLFGIKKSSHLT